MVVNRTGFDQPLSVVTPLAAAMVETSDAMCAVVPQEQPGGRVCWRSRLVELWSGNSVLPTLLVVLLFLSAARWYEAGATKVASSLALVGATVLFVQRAPSRRWFVDWLGASGGGGGGEGSGQHQHKRRRTTTIDEATKAEVSSSSSTLVDDDD